jgi:hypothetical protein
MKPAPSVSLYPEELQLNRENDTYFSTDFLDLHIELQDGIFTTSLFDKRDHFGFDITRLPFRDSNIPDRMFYSSIAAECLRICRATSLSDNAITSIKAVIARMIKQGAALPKIKNCLRKMCVRHHVYKKFDVQGNTFLDKLFS